MGETEVLAEYVAEARYEDLPAEVVERTKEVVADTIACGLGGRKTREGDILIDIMKEIGGKPEATVIGDPLKLSCTQAALVNRVLTNMMDYDDTVIENNTGHLSTVLVPVALAIGEHVNASGRDIINALVPAYDVVVRLRAAVNPSEEAFHKSFQERIDSGASFGVTVVTGKLLGLNGGQMADAFGLNGRVRTWRVPHQDPVQPKGGQARWMKVTGGDVVIPGIHAAFLAHRGFPGQRYILDRDQGYETFIGSDRYDAQKLIADLGKNYAVMKIGFKFYSACRFTSSTSDAIAAIVTKNNIKAEDVEQITAKVQRDAAEGFAIYEPEHIIQAQFSIPFIATMVLLREPTGPNWYTEDKIKNPKIRELQHKVRLEEDPEATKARWSTSKPRFMSTVEITMKDGRHFRECVEYPKGEPQNPFTRQEHIAKLTNMASWLGMRPSQIDKLIQTLDKLEELGSISELTRLLVP